jgi:hypothetical protein
MFYASQGADILNANKISPLVFSGVANDCGYECLIIERATASTFLRFTPAAMDMIRVQGAIVGWTTQPAGFAAALA